MQIETVEISDVYPDSRNVRQHPERNIAGIKTSLQRWGQQKPIVIDKNRVVIAGNGTLQAAKELGWQTIQVVYSELGGAERTAYSLADNSLSDSSSFSPEIAALLDEIKVSIPDIDLAALCLSDLDLAGIVGDIAEPETPAAQPIEHGSLAERFIVPPFTVLDTRQGYWRERRQLWETRKCIGQDVDTDTIGSADKSEGRTCMAHISEGTSADIRKRFEASGYVSSVFDPVLCEVVYRWFMPAGRGRVLDPFAGEATKGLVATYLGHEYTGIELRERQAAANTEQAKALGLAPRWVVGDSARLGELVPDSGYDLIFTSPPYYDLEIYSKSDKDGSAFASYENFREWYRDIFQHATDKLKENRFLVVKVSEIRDKKTGVYRGFVRDNIDIFQGLGLNYYNEAILVNSAGSLPVRVAGRSPASGMFTLTRKLGKCHQNVLVFFKGDVSTIKSNYPAEIEHGTVTDEREEN